ncbi:MAG: PAS domain S-box protein [Gammaproteobacteria bacterium]|nr:PAS domain S-box protein [Gammaproteobacteria bacterium]
MFGPQYLSSDMRSFTVHAVSPLLLIGLLLLSLFGGYLLFHTLAELFAILIAYTMFMVAWFTHRFLQNNFVLFLGIAYFWIGTMDLAHTLTYKEMGIFPQISANISIQIWIATRYMEALTLLVAPLFFVRSFHRQGIFHAYGLVVVVLLYLIYLGRFPDTFIEGEGLTPFKVYSEYVIIALTSLAIAMISRMRHYLELSLFGLMVAAMMVTMLAELVFTSYVSLDDLAIVSGHILKFISFWLIFVAIVRSALTEPYQLMSRTTSTYDAIPDPIVVVDSQGRISQVNKAVYQFLGLDINRVMDRHCHDLFHNTQVNSRDCVVCQHIENGEALEGYELFNTHQQKWMRISLAPVMANQLNIGMVHSTSDITQAKLAMESLRNSEEIFRQLAEHINEVFWVRDPRTDINIYVSPAFERIWGYSVTELYREPLRFLQGIHEEDRQSVIDALPRQPIGDYDQTYRVQHTNGSTFWIRDRAFPVCDEQGEIYRLVGIAEDITQQLEVKQERQKNQAKNEFLSRMSHELRTPLNALLGFGQLLESERDTLSSDQKIYVAECMKAGHHLLALIDEVLDIAKIESREMNFAMTRVDVRAVVNECLSVTQTIAEQHGIKVDNNLAADELRILTDHLRIKQVLINLLTNAIKYNRKGGSVSCQAVLEQDGMVKISVIDTGIGIREEDMERVFQPFERIYNPEVNIDGTGIGLALSQSLVQLMGGEIGIESELGRGSHFWVRFPAV